MTRIYWTQQTKRKLSRYMPYEEEDLRERPFSLSFEEETDPYYHLLKRDTGKIKIKLA